jgi:hypothetical protein
MQIPGKLRQFINGPHGMNMGTRDAHLKPEYARVLGTNVVDDQHIHVYFDRKTSGRTLRNFEDNGLVSIILVSLENFESYQLKGKSVSWRDSTPEDLQNIAEYLKKFNDGIVRLGLPDKAVYAYPHSAMCTLLMEIDEIFEQTPKKGTGQKVML